MKKERLLISSLQSGKPGTIPAKSTSDVEIDMNLDVRAVVKQFDINDAENTSNYSTSLTVHDSVGTPRLDHYVLQQIENGTWEYHATVEGKDAEGGEVGKIYEMASGKLKFNKDGILEEEVEDSSSFNFADGAQPDQKIKFSFGETLKEGGDGSKASTSFGCSINDSKAYPRWICSSNTEFSFI